MAEPRVPAGYQGRAARYKRWAAASLKLLSNDDLDILRRARAGAPPGFVLGPVKASDAHVCVDHALTSIERTSRKLLGAYEWPECDGIHYPRSGFVDGVTSGAGQSIGPDWMPDGRSSRLRYEQRYDQICPHCDRDGNPIEGQPDIRQELLSILLHAAQARSALEDGLDHSAFLLAMRLGVLICRVSWMLFDGSATATGAAAHFARPEAHQSRRENETERLGPRNEEIRRLDRLCRLKGKAERAGQIKAGWLTGNERILGLDRWAADYNHGRDSGDQIRVLSVNALSRLLPTRK